VDTSKYQTGLRTCLNFIIARHGGAYNRPGTKFITEVVDSTKKSRIIPFIFNNDQTYILEFADQKIRFIRNGARVVEAAKTANNGTVANPVEITTSAAHGYTTGDTVLIERPSTNVLSGMLKELVDNTFAITVTGGTTFTLNGVNGLGFAAWAGTADVSKVYEITSPYLEADLFDLHFVQSADVITIVHPDYAPRELSRTGHTSWSLDEIAFKPTEPHPTAASGSGTAGSNTYKYKVTAIDPETQEESLPGVEAAVGGGIDGITIGGGPSFTVTVSTASNHGLSDGDTVLIDGITGTTELNGRRFEIENASADNFDLVDENGSGYTAWSAGGTVAREEIYITNVTDPATNSHTITWTGASDVKEYAVYFEENGVFGFIGTAGSETFVNEGTPPDTADTPPRERNPFRVSGTFPSTVSYYQQRRVFAGSDDEPETIFTSRTGFHSNFTTSYPIKDDDAIRFTLAGRRVNRIRNLLDLGTLVAFTSGSEWTINGDSAGTLIPSAINARQETYFGSSNLQPIIVGRNALFVQDRGSVVRDLLQDFEVSGYRGSDLTVFASHLFEGFTLDDLTYHQVPNSIAWFVRSDGVLLGMTYVPEQQIFAWHQHSMGVAVESVEAIPSGQEDLVYVISNRTVNGSTVRYIEEMQTRLIGDQEDMIFMDSAYTYDGRNTDTTLTATVTGGTDWDEDESLTLTFSSAVHGGGVGSDEIHLFDTDGSIVRFTVEAAPGESTTGTVFTVRPDRTMPVGLRGVATSSWTRAKKVIYGLHHLVADDLSVLGDAHVVGSPNDPDQTTYTVASDGSLTLDRAYGTIHAGIAYLSDLETLDIDITGGGTLSDWKKNPTAIGLLIESTMSAYAGTSPPADGNDANDGLFEYKIRNLEDYDDPTSLTTGYIQVNAPGTWNHGGRVFVRQIDPLPLGVLGVLPIGSLPTGGRL
jgi:hypothetical protein